MSFTCTEIKHSERITTEIKYSERIRFPEVDDTLITTEAKFAMKLIDFFSNFAINFKIPKFQNFDPLSENINNPTLKDIAKYRKHPSIIVIALEFTKECFSFNTIALEDAV